MKSQLKHIAILSKHAIESIKGSVDDIKVIPTVVKLRIAVYCYPRDNKLLWFTYAVKTDYWRQKKTIRWNCHVIVDFFSKKLNSFIPRTYVSRIYPRLALVIETLLLRCRSLDVSEIWLDGLLLRIQIKLRLDILFLIRLCFSISWQMTYKRLYKLYIYLVTFRS